ncbi:glycoside hydrolase family 18 protein [Aspergillus melleus]|uniref:glycoside hydrolase family 18 protein n=1 Tax=Aspergillus melleus TaxID=138277 RepID=UPI001E8EC2DD|nr:Chitinase 4 [Aspergillus melleus]KAH8435411.1 Chitinase 4 [Aspergillus melleus]
MDGRVTLPDSYTDIEKRYPTDAVNDPQQKDMYGTIKQIMKLKSSNRHLKALLSIGGWGTALNFTGATSTESNRKNFALTALELVKDLGFDGLDIDWEAENYVLLLAEVRTALDRYSERSAAGKKFLLTVASSAAPSNIQMLNLAAMDRYVDFWNLMAYDYAGSWDSTSGHTANVYADPAHPTDTKGNTDSAINSYIKQGIRSDKIVLGMPLYGRSFMNTKGPGMPFQGVGKGTWEAGVWDYKDMPPIGSRQHDDERLIASYSYDGSTRTMISYDTPTVALWKANYIVARHLGGAMWWESSGDKTNDESLISTVFHGLGGKQSLERSQNHLSYPESRYGNIREWLL